MIIQLQTSRRFVSSSILLPTYLLGLRGGRFPALGQHPLGGLGPHQPLEVDAAAALGRDAQPREGNQEGRLPLLRNWRGHGGLASNDVMMGWGPLYSQIYEENQVIYPESGKLGKDRTFIL